MNINKSLEVSLFHSCITATVFVFDTRVPKDYWLAVVEIHDFLEGQNLIFLFFNIPSVRQMY